MKWEPLGYDELTAMIVDAERVMEPNARRFWNLIRVPPVKWAHHPWGDEGGGFWVVGILGMHVLWYNDIEDGFNLSRYDSPGLIQDYWCNQDELQHALYGLLRQIDFGEARGSFGPPEALP